MKQSPKICNIKDLNENRCSLSNENVLWKQVKDFWFSTPFQSVLALVKSCFIFLNLKDWQKTQVFLPIKSSSIVCLSNYPTIIVGWAELLFWSSFLLTYLLWLNRFPKDSSLAFFHQLSMEDTIEQKTNNF